MVFTVSFLTHLARSLAMTVPSFTIRVPSFAIQVTWIVIISTSNAKLGTIFDKFRAFTVKILTLSATFRDTNVKPVRILIKFRTPAAKLRTPIAPLQTPAAPLRTTSPHFRASVADFFDYFTVFLHTPIASDSAKGIGQAGLALSLPTTIRNQRVVFPAGAVNFFHAR